jgi:hypothetical protein
MGLKLLAEKMKKDGQVRAPVVRSANTGERRWPPKYVSND